MMHWMEKLTRAIEQGTLSPAEATYVRIEHDDRCGIFNGLVCGCDAVVKFRRNGRMVVIGSDGKAAN